MECWERGWGWLIFGVIIKYIGLVRLSFVGNFSGGVVLNIVLFFCGIFIILNCFYEFKEYLVIYG